MKTVLYEAAPGGGNKREILFNEILKICVNSRDYSRVLYLSPSTQVMAEVNRGFFSWLKKIRKSSAYIPFRTSTLRQFASGLYEIYGDRDPVSDRMRTLFFSELLRNGNTGRARLLSDLYRKIRHHLPGRTLTCVKDEIGQLIFEEKAKERALNAMDVLEQYEDELMNKNLIDPDDVLINSIEFIKNDARRTSFDGSFLIIEGFFDPSPLELEIMDALAGKAEEVYVLAEEDTEILRHFRAKEGVFIKRTEKQMRRKNAGYFSYPSVEGEVEGIAKNIKKLLLEGVKPEKVSVCFPAPEKYLPIMRRVCKKYGVPLSIGEFSLSGTRPFILLEEIISCMEEDYPRTAFLSVLTSPWLPAIPEIIKQNAVVWSYRAGVVKGKDSWLSIKQMLLNASRNGEVEYGEGINVFQKELSSIVEIIEGLKDKRDLCAFVDAFVSALDRLGFFLSLQGPDSVRGEDIAAGVRSQLAELRSFGEIYGRRVFNADTPGFYLRYMFSELKGAAQNREGVKFLPFELAACVETEYLFFGGMMEGDFPSRPGIDPILPERVKKSLGMPYLEYYLRRQKLYFRRLLNATFHEPCFSFPSADGDKVFLPSPFLDWGEPAAPPELDIFSEEDALIIEGSIQDLGGNSEGVLGVEITDGRERDSALIDLIEKVSGGAINVTDIDYYRKCPLRFYIERVLGLEMEKPPKFEVDSRLWGSLAHRTMEHVFKDGGADTDELDEKIFQGLQKSLQEFPIDEFWAGVAGEIFRKLLPAIKEREKELRMEGLDPYLTEQKISAKVEGVRLKGKVDRVDIKSGVRSQESKGTVVLFDYKTGHVDKDSLQLPLYAAMWQESRTETVAEVGYYSLKDERIIRYPNKGDINTFISYAVSTAQELLKNMKKGVFQAKPFKATECRYCRHAPLCKK